MKYLIMIFAILLNILIGTTYAQSNLNTEKCIPCEKLNALKIPDVKITEAIVVSTGSSHCKISGIIGKVPAIFAAYKKKDMKTVKANLNIPLEMKYSLYANDIFYESAPQKIM